MTLGILYNLGEITRKTTCTFAEPENFVVLECITKLIDKGYFPKHIELKKEWALSRKKKNGFADIHAKDEEGKTLFIIECKTVGAEYKKSSIIGSLAYCNVMCGSLFLQRIYFMLNFQCLHKALWVLSVIDTKIENLPTAISLFLT